jgi:hypothetical protein
VSRTSRISYRDVLTEAARKQQGFVDDMARIYADAEMKGEVEFTDDARAAIREMNEADRNKAAALRALAKLVEEAEQLVQPVNLPATQEEFVALKARTGRLIDFLAAGFDPEEASR